MVGSTCTGMRQIEAHDALIGFIASASGRAKKTRCEHRQGSFSPAKACCGPMSAALVNEPPLRGKIVAHHPAHPRTAVPASLYSS